ncbi:hypothetical protein Taro_020466, partial [Colocasia esculenta]|nr:hypothetical protein [Colocasia esculenta]
MNATWANEDCDRGRQIATWGLNLKNEEEAPRTPSSYEILSSLASSPCPTTFGNELGLAKR